MDRKPSRKGDLSMEAGKPVPGSRPHHPPAGGIGTQLLEKKKKQNPSETGKFLLPERNALPRLRDQADFAWPAEEQEC